MFSSVQFSHSVVSDSLQPHESQHTRPPCSSPSPGVHSDSHPSSLWCHPASSSSVVPFSSCPQSLPASESFPMSQLFSWDVTFYQMYVTNKNSSKIMSCGLDIVCLKYICDDTPKNIQEHDFQKWIDFSSFLLYILLYIY